MTQPYAMESATEAERLEGKTQEAVTRDHLGRVGLTEGMRALDAGAGTGAVARTMAAIVGPRGEVTAFDASAERLAHGSSLPEAKALPNLRFVVGDLYAPPLPPSSFDFVWSRFVFEYLEDPDRVLAQLISLTRPGGKIVIGDLDGNTTFHYPEPEPVRLGMDRILAALGTRFDPYAGRKLFHRFCKAGLRDIRVHHLPYHLYAGRLPDAERPNWEAKWKTIRPVGVRALGGERAYDAFVEAYMAMLDEPSTLTYSTLFLVEGLR